MDAFEATVLISFSLGWHIIILLLKEHDFILFLLLDLKLECSLVGLKRNTRFRNGGNFF